MLIVVLLPMRLKVVGCVNEWLIVSKTRTAHTLFSSRHLVVSYF